MIVYVIEQGEYSDRCVVAVRETLEEAKAYVDLKRKAEGNRYFPERYSVSCFDTKGMIIYSKNAYEIHFMPDGSICYVYKIEDQTNYLDWCEYENPMIIHADSEEQARKIAYDRLAELKARKAGIV